MNLVLPLPAEVGEATAPARDPDPWPGEGQRWVTEPRKQAPGLDALLVWAYEHGASRIAFQTGHPVWVRIHGRNRRATRGMLSEVELGDITNHLYGADGTARLQGGSDFDVSYEVGLSRSRRLRFRLNATPIRAARREGANIVLRPIPDLPPSLAQQLVEPGILAACFPERGMVIVSGGTGSGKSTLIAGMTVAKLADPEGHYNIQEAAAPVEFLLDRFPTASSTMAQTEVPRDLPSFKWVNTVLGNLKTTLAGAFHALNYRKYAEHYLAGFAYRFNRRFDLRGLVASLIVDVVRAKPIKEKTVRSHAEARF